MVAQKVEGHPSSNTDATCTVTVDWLAFTWFTEVSLFDIFPELEGVGFTRLKAGMNGYLGGAHVGPVLWLWDGTPQMGQHCSLSGAAVRWVTSVVEGGLLGLMARIHEIGDYSVSRLDIAVDFVNTVVSDELLRESFNSGNWVGYLRSWREWSSRDRDGTINPGVTFYVGSSKGDVMVRLYDKLAEQKVHSVGHVLSGLEGVQNWWRFEWQFRRLHARTVFGMFALDDMEKVLAFCLKYLDFVDPSSDSNKRRWKRAEWFSQLVGHVERGTAVVVQSEWDATSARRWVIESASRTLFKVSQVFEGHVDVVAEILEAGSSRMTDVDWEEVRAARGVVQLPFDELEDEE